MQLRLIYFWLDPRHPFYYHVFGMFFVVESFFLLIPCLCSTTPLFLLISLMERLRIYYGLFFALDQFFYIILFLLFIRASTCKPQTEIS
jgi:hypothetical protein